MLERWKCAVLRAEASDGRRNLAARREFNATRRALRGGATSWRGLYGQAKEAAGSARDEGARVAREGWRFAPPQRDPREGPQEGELPRKNSTRVTEKTDN